MAVPFDDNMTPAQSFEVRRAKAEDLAAILECLHEAFEPYRKAYTPGAYADTVLTPAGLKQRFSEMCVFVAASMDTEIIGTVSCNRVTEREGYIRGMAVRTAWQGKGVAQRLLEAVEVELCALGCQRVTLDTTEPLLRAVSFYTRNGFRPTGAITDFFGMPLYEYGKELRCR